MKTEIELHYISGEEICSHVPCCDCPVRTSLYKGNIPCPERLDRFIKGRKLTLVINEPD